jgi:hypothetical protein
MHNYEFLLPKTVKRGSGSASRGAVPRIFVHSMAETNETTGSLTLHNQVDVTEGDERADDLPRAKRSQVKLACTQCRSRHTRCNETNPCEMCVRLGTAHLCERVKRRKPRAADNLRAYLFQLDPSDLRGAESDGENEDAKPKPVKRRWSVDFGGLHSKPLNFQGTSGGPRISTFMITPAASAPSSLSSSSSQIPPSASTTTPTSAATTPTAQHQPPAKKPRKELSPGFSSAPNENFKRRAFSVDYTALAANQAAGMLFFFTKKCLLRQTPLIPWLKLFQRITEEVFPRIFHL